MSYPLGSEDLVTLVPRSDHHVWQRAGNIRMDLGYVLLQTVVVRVAFITEVAGEGFSPGMCE